MFTDMRAARGTEVKTEKPQEKPTAEKPAAEKPKKPKEPKEKTTTDAAQPSKTAKQIDDIRIQLDAKFTDLSAQISRITAELAKSPTQQVITTIPERIVEDWEIIYRSNKKRFKPNTPLRDILERLNKMIKGAPENVAP